MYTKILALACLGVALSGCATVIKGSTEQVAVSTSPVSGATCELSSSEGEWTVTTPGTANVGLTKHDLEVQCDKPGYQQAKATVPSGFQVWTVGNVLIGGLIGIAIDAGTGAMNEYPHSVDVPMSPETTGAAAPTPAPTASSSPSS
jgi:hypothetical protein